MGIRTALSQKHAQRSFVVRVLSMEWLSRVGAEVVAAILWFVGLMTAEEWQASAAVATFIVAGAAALYARGQVNEARRSREDQTRPYVAAYLELSDNSTLELVIKNFGTTTARNVTVTSDVPMKRHWGNEVEDLLLFEELPVLVPGQDWRTLFDVAGQRMDANNYDLYTLVVSYGDIRGRPLDAESFIIDWRPFQHKQYVGRKTINDIGESVQGIDKTLATWTEGRGLAVVSRNGHKKDAAAEQRRVQRYANYERLRPTPVNPAETQDGTTSDASASKEIIVEAPEADDVNLYPRREERAADLDTPTSAGRETDPASLAEPNQEERTDAPRRATDTSPEVVSPTESRAE